MTGAGPPFAGAGGVVGGNSPHHQQACAFFDQHLAAHANLTALQQQKYRQAAFAVIGRMADDAAERLNRHVAGYRLFPDLVSLNQYFFPRLSAAQIAQLVNLSMHQLGAYNETTGEIEANGESTVGPWRFSVEYVLAHECSHAIDGPQHEITSTQDWQDAWDAEIKPAFPQQHAARDTQEGFTKFGQMLLDGSTSRLALEQRFPRCADVWKKWGIL